MSSKYSFKFTPLAEEDIGSAFGISGRYIRFIPQSVVSATENPLYAIYFGSERNSLFLPSEESMQMPFLPCSRASRMHSLSKSFEYPCPLRLPAIHRQLI